MIGLKTIETMARAGASCLAIDAGKCLFLDGDKIIAAADEAGISVVAEAPAS
ncbi:MAG TPA: UDP-2,3-diacylglucosamine diphosphatase LpxI [Candidatus Angelobacter sp.]